MAEQNIWHGPADYQIKIKGNIGNQWSDWFGGVSIKSEGKFILLTVKGI